MSTKSIKTFIYLNIYNISSPRVLRFLLRVFDALVVLLLLLDYTWLKVSAISGAGLCSRRYRSRFIYFDSSLSTLEKRFSAFFHLFNNTTSSSMKSNDIGCNCSSIWIIDLIKWATWALVHQLQSLFTSPFFNSLFILQLNAIAMQSYSELLNWFIIISIMN